MGAILAWTGQGANVYGAGGPPSGGGGLRRAAWTGVLLRSVQGRAGTHTHPADQDEDAGQHLLKDGSASGEADLREPVVQPPALLTEHTQLLQRRVLPGALSRVLWDTRRCQWAGTLARTLRECFPLDMDAP